MFDFEKLEVYQKAKVFNRISYQYISQTNSLDRTTKDQLRRASFSIMLNIAEGCSRYSKPDRRNFYVIARGSVFECVAIFDFLKEENLMHEAFYKDCYNKAEELSKMMYAMIKSLS
jgi:four helix bundle protein